MELYQHHLMFQTMTSRKTKEIKKDEYVSMHKERPIKDLNGPKLVLFTPLNASPPYITNPSAFSSVCLSVSLSVSLFFP